MRPALVRRGFASLTAVQAAIVAADDGRRDLRITSQTGSGKTVALGLVCSRDLEAPAPANAPLVLVIAPTRELAAQVKEELAWLFADLPGVGCQVVTGGTNLDRERLQLQRKPAVLVGTPGRLLDHLRNGALDLGQVRQLVLDEADQMLDLGFKDELDAILAALPADRRTHLVSATFPFAVRALADKFQRDALLVTGTPTGQAHGDIEHVALQVGARDQYHVLVNLLLLAGEERTLVFVRTREDTQGLADKLAGDGFLAMPIHGDLAQSQRTRTLQSFRRGSIHTLIATDVAARGLDITDVTAVVNFDLPIDAETYVHRSGRTGRAGQKGTSYLLVVKSREMRARHIYRLAKVQPRWAASPGAAEVRAHQREQALERIGRQLTASGELGPELRAAAARLLADRDPVAVVATLLQQATNGVREPFEVLRNPNARPFTTTAAAPTPPPVPPPVAPAPARAPTKPATEPTPDPAAPPTAKAPATPKPATPAAPVAPAVPAAKGAPSRREPQPEFVRFRINWGRRDGADPRRVMAHVCRRGHIQSRQVGAISIQFAFTSVEVARDVAESFQRAVERPDRREPHLFIEREGPGRRQRH
ncbi:MAG: DEAD/DEAH box helicase [Planctomycetes bacterium]|nr:DEAD/DEAH box helicase [Planctomycetota bacterium]